MPTSQIDALRAELDGLAGLEADAARAHLDAASQHIAAAATWITAHRSRETMAAEKARLQADRQEEGASHA